MTTTAQLGINFSPAYLVKIPGSRNLMRTISPGITVRNVTAFAYSSKFPLGENQVLPSLFIVADEYNCPHEFQSWEEARQYYMNQSSEVFVGLWRIFAVYGISQLPA